MRKNIFNYEGEEKEISLSHVKDIDSNVSIANSPKNKKKVKFESFKLPIGNTKTFADAISQKDNNPPEIFERRKKKFHTLLVKQSKIFENNNNIKKKKRRKGKYKTVKIIDKKSKKENNLQEKEKKSQGKISAQIDEKEDEKEEFEEKEMQTKLEVVLEKKFSPTQTMLSYCKCQLYISYDNMTGFEYTGLEGILCIVINRLLSNLYLQIYDIMDFKKQFEIELYTNISLNRGYEVMNSKFHTIEFPTFCLGLNFYTVKKAEEIKDIILNYSKALNSSLFYQYEKLNHDTFKQKKLFDYISDPKKVLNYNDKRKKTIKEPNNQNENYNLNNENDSTYLESIFGNMNKNLSYKISSNEQMLSFNIDREENEVIFDTSKGANRFLEQNNIEISDINDEYEKMKEQVKSKMKNNKFITNKNKKSIQEEIKAKENKEKIMEILNQIEGLQTKDKNALNFEEEKEKFNNKIKKFNVTKRLPINQKMQINSSPENLIFYGDDSESLGAGEENHEEDDEEGEEEEDDEENKENNEEENNEEENNIIKNLLNNVEKNSNLNVTKEHYSNIDKISNEQKNDTNDNEKEKSIKLQLSGISKKNSNSSEICSSDSVKNENNKSNVKQLLDINFSTSKHNSNKDNS